jgi:hypothetical protein
MSRISFMMKLTREGNISSYNEERIEKHWITSSNVVLFRFHQSIAQFWWVSSTKEEYNFSGESRNNFNGLNVVLKQNNLQFYAKSNNIFISGKTRFLINLWQNNFITNQLEVKIVKQLRNKNINQILTLNKFFFSS